MLPMSRQERKVPPRSPAPQEEGTTVRRPVPAYSVRATSAVSSRNCFLRLVHTSVTVC